MTAPRLIRLVPTGEVFQGVDLVEPCEVQPLTHPELHQLDWPSGWSFDEVLKFARAIEQAHGIGRRMDA